MNGHGESADDGTIGAQDVLLLAAAVALPWFFGGIGLDALRGAAAVIALAGGWALVRQGAPGLGLGRRALWLLPAFLLGAWAFAQTVPLPRSWVAALSPKAAAIQANAFGPEGLTGSAWLRGIEDDARARVPEAPSAAANRAGPLEVGREAPEPPRRFTLSLRPESTSECAFWYAALLLAFLLAWHRTASERRAAVYRATLFASFAALAGIGILNRVLAPGRLLWLQDAPEEAKPFGPYVNPSHFGGAMELAVPWLLGYGLWALAGHGVSDRRPGRSLALAGAGVGAAACILAASKMAVVTIGVASVVLIGVAMRRWRGRWGLFAGTAAAVLVLGAIALAGPLSLRVADFAALHEGQMSPNIRGLAWSAALRMAADYVTTGSGFGAFSHLISAYLPRGDSERWNELHNDYLEVFLAGGLVGAVFVVWLAVAFARRAVRVVRSEFSRGRGLPALGLALGLLALAAHEAVDFNLQIPANALLFVVIAAMAVSPLAAPVEDP